MKNASLLNKDIFRIVLAFIFSFVPALILPIMLPMWRLTFFAPFLIITYYKTTFYPSLWISLICGMIIDLLSSYPHLGLHGAAYCATTWCLYSQKRNFFEDRLSTLPLMTAFFSFLSTVFLFILVLIFAQPIPFSAGLVITDFVFMPACDALYAFVWFTLPAVFMPRSPKREYFLNRTTVKK